jgi:UDP-glucose 4-epimerase
MAKILITGGAGFIGSSLAERLANTTDHKIVVVDNLLTGDVKRLKRLEDKIRFIKADCNNFQDISSVMLAYKFDYVFHYAAVVGVQRTLDNPTLVLEDISGIKNVLDLAKNTNVKRVFYASSSEVYGEPIEHPQNEATTPLNSRLPYAVVKNVGESFLRSYKQEFDLDYTIFRFFNTYGPKQSTDFVMSKFIDVATKNKDITIFGDGMQTRTFCYINDNIDACLSSFEHGHYTNDTVNVGSDCEVTILQLAEIVIKVTGSNSKIVHLPALKEGDMKKRKPDIEKMRKLLGRELMTIEEGIKQILATGIIFYGK